MDPLDPDSSTPPPVIVIGMHRSGTSLLSRLLDRMGVFMGYRLDEHHEALFFQNLNRWLLNMAGTTWDTPETFRYVLRTPEIRSSARDYLRRHLQSIRFWSYLGPINGLRRSFFRDMPVPWGWKDPRNTVTLPLWLDLYPEARVVHILRHGMDVARSLVERSQKRYRTMRQRFTTWYGLYDLYWKSSGLTDSVRCMTLEGAFELWEEYLTFAYETIEKKQESLEVREIRFERLLDRPGEVLGDLAAFCGLNAASIPLEDIGRTIDSSRAYSYRSSDRLADKAWEWKHRLQRFGYGSSLP